MQQRFELNARFFRFIFIFHFSSLTSTSNMLNYSHCDSTNPSESCLSSFTINQSSLFVPVFSISLVIVMCIGVLGNLLVIYVVLNYGRLKTVTNTYLLHLALSDLVFLSGIPFFVSSLMTRAWIFGAFVCKLFFLTQGVNQFTSVIILALLAFDRYLAVCYSSKSIIWRARVNPNLLLILTWILSFILMLPVTTFTDIHTGGHGSKAQCIITLPFPQSRVFYYIVVGYTSTITFFLPISLMIYFYIRIVARLKHKVSQSHRRSRSSMRTRRKVSVLVLAVISVHIFCCAPYWAVQVITTSELLPQTSSILMPLTSVAQFLLYVNSSMNPIVYAFISEIFRLSFKRVFYCCLPTDAAPYLDGKSGNKRNLSLTSNKTDHYLQIKENRISLKIIKNENQQLSLLPDEIRPMRAKSISFHPSIPPQRQQSVDPPLSHFSSDPSIISDT